MVDGKDSTLIFELTRTHAPQDPYAFRFEPQTYSLRTEGGGREVIEIDWGPALLADLEAVRRPDRDPVVVQRLGEAMARFLERAAWAARARSIVEAAGSEPVVITLRSNAAELYALPWELLVLPGSGQHVGALPNVLIRYERPETRTTSPLPSPRPEGGRILLAWSAAGGGVPAAEHEAAVRGACRRGHPQGEDALELLPHAGVRGIADALARAQRAGRPFAVLHLLCHGGRSGQSFGLVLDGDSRAVTVTADTFRTVLAPYAGGLRLVLLSACEGGNAGEPGNHLGSVAQALHAAGLEAVVASRQPLSRSGSITLAEQLYQGLLCEHESLERALLRARGRLVLDPDHLDWAALQLHARAADGFDTRPFVLRPFRGLLAFGAEQAPFFYGREVERREVLVDLQALVDAGKPRLLVVAGASGTGKSSLVRAGAVPDILATRGGRWEHAIIRPGDEPLAALDAALAGRRDESCPFLLVVDQLEELFTHTRDRQVRVDFVRRLWALARQDTGVCCILGLRVDFLGRCGELRLDDEGTRLDTVAYDESHRVFVAQMSPAQLMDAITEPARRVGLSLAEGLAERIVGEVGVEPGALPLMQYTLDLMWQRRRGRELSVEAYEQLGGVVGSLERRADALLDELREDELQLARQLLTHLVGLGDDDTGDTRRRVPLEQLWPAEPELRPVAEGVLRRFVDERLVVRDDRDQGGATVEIAHEALIRRWDRLRDWLGDERERRIGRYIVLERLREGSREEVDLGYDPELDRRVTIRLLRVGRRGSEERARLRDQARALARIAHPNVPAVYDVGVAKGHVYVAMEVIEGSSLREWVAERPRAWPEVVAIFVQVAEGLEAAHGLGVLHRGFTPDAVRIDGEGVPRIMGFGFDRHVELADAGRSARTLAARKLARASGPLPVASVQGPDALPAEPSVLASMTESSVLGNPAYLPPEQLRGLPVGPAGDQFGFCVALYEMLFGDRPFAGDGLAAFARAVSEARPTTTARDETIPEELRKVLLRGLAGAPQDRWPSMAALAAELRAVSRQRRSRRASLGIAGLVAVGLVGAGTAWWVARDRDREPEPSACPSAEERLAGVWDDERRKAAKARILGTVRAHAVSTWKQLEPRLDDYARAWSEAHAAACEAAVVEPGEDARRRLACVEARRVELREAVGVLVEADPRVLEHAVDLVVALPSIDACADPRRGRESIPWPGPDESSPELSALRERLVAARARRSGGHEIEAEAEAQAVLERAEGLGFGPAQAEAL
ncbi:MAG: CHAT domain-containing protein, partial [Myxococcales bacterium]|nr:CHAT domain-containing protein [Myxococcales bacterium]